MLVLALYSPFLLNYFSEGVTIVINIVNIPKKTTISISKALKIGGKRP